MISRWVAGVRRLRRVGPAKRETRPIGTTRRGFESLEQRCLLAGNIAIVETGQGDVASYMRSVTSPSDVLYTPVRSRAAVDMSAIVADLDAGFRVTVDTANDGLTRLGDITVFVPPSGRTIDFARITFRADNDFIVNAVSSFKLIEAARITADDLVINLESPASLGTTTAIDLGASLDLSGSLKVNGSPFADRLIVTGLPVDQLSIRSDSNDSGQMNLDAHAINFDSIDAVTVLTTSSRTAITLADQGASVVSVDTSDSVELSSPEGLDIVVSKPTRSLALVSESSTTVLDVRSFDGELTSGLSIVAAEVNVIGDIQVQSGPVVIVAADRLQIQSGAALVGEAIRLSVDPMGTDNDDGGGLIAIYGRVKSFDGKVEIIGGDDEDTLIVDPDGEIHSTTFDYAGTESGTIDVSGMTRIQFTGIELIESGPSVDVAFLLRTNSAHDVVLRAADRQGFIELLDSGMALPTTSLANPLSRLTVRLGDSGDSVAISTLDNDYHASLVIVGGEGEDNVTLDSVTITDSPGRGLDLAGVESVAINNSNFSGNAADFGAGVRLIDATATITNSIFIGNTATISGGGLFVQGGQLNITGTTFRSNIAAGTGGYVSEGGGLYVAESDPNRPVTISDSIFDQNIAEAGGGIAIVDSRVAMDSSTISANRSTMRVFGGGGILVSATRRGLTELLTLSSSDVFGNMSAGEGGGILVVASSVSIVDSSVRSNDAEGGAGGGISGYARGIAGDIRVLRSAISGNSAAKSGGGIAVLGTGIALNDVSIDGNHAGTIGGGIDSSNDDPSRVGSMIGVSVVGNTASEGGANIAETGRSIVRGDNVSASNITLDVSGDGEISPLDVLRVINQIARAGAESAELTTSVSRRHVTDVNGDGRTTAIDALMILNQLVPMRDEDFISSGG